MGAGMENMNRGGGFGMFFDAGKGVVQMLGVGG